jgi:hypothetical protein
MEDIFPFLIGFSGKIIDDIDDQKLNFNEVFIQSLTTSVFHDGNIHLSNIYKTCLKKTHKSAKYKGGLTIFILFMPIIK